MRWKVEKVEKVERVEGVEGVEVAERLNFRGIEYCQNPLSYLWGRILTFNQ